MSATVATIARASAESAFGGRLGDEPDPGRGKGRGNSPMRWNASVSFESETMPPETIRLAVEAGTVATAAARAIREAKRQRPGRRFRSVALLLERAEADAPEGV